MNLIFSSLLLLPNMAVAGTAAASGGGILSPYTDTAIGTSATGSSAGSVFVEDDGGRYLEWLGSDFSPTAQAALTTAIRNGTASLTFRWYYNANNGCSAGVTDVDAAYTATLCTAGTCIGASDLDSWTASGTVVSGWDPITVTFHDPTFIFDSSSTLVLNFSGYGSIYHPAGCIKYGTFNSYIRYPQLNW